MKPLAHTLAQWQLSPIDEPPARLDIPTLTVETPTSTLEALVASGLLPEPTRDFNEQDVSWVSRTRWRWITTCQLSEQWFERDAIDLCLDGVDTVASLVINGHPVAELANMHQRHRFSVGAFLQPGANQLQIDIHPALPWARSQMDRLGSLPWIRWTEEPMPWNFIRKMACSFGWDWGPALVDSGIHGEVRLEARSAGRIAAVAPRTTITDDRAQLDLQITIERTEEKSPLVLAADLFAPDGTENPVASSVILAQPDETCVRTSLSVSSPRLWWPVGYGTQPLYRLVVRLLRQEDQPAETNDAQADNGVVVDTWAHRIGLRSVVLDTSDDKPGHRFVIRVNGREIFCKGANWIPDDVLITRSTRSDYQARIQDALQAHHNTLRVWGGGIYERDVFYNLCDEMGVLVWQDFLFACAMYPEEPPFPDLVATEATDQTRRLAHHPSLVLWNGNNENFWGYLSWGHPRWKEQVGDRGWGTSYYLNILSRTVARESPATPYFPGSPYSGQPADTAPASIHPLHDDSGTRHVWDAWNDTSADAYLDYRPRFAAEFGFQGPMNWATLQQAYPDTDIDTLEPRSPELLFRQRAIDGAAKLEARLAERFHTDGLDLHRWHHLTQVNQAESVYRGVTWFRSLWPHCTGTLYWQLNDCWPAISWASVDSAGRRKPLWYALRRAYAPRSVTIQPALKPPDGSRPHQASPRPEWNAQHSIDAAFSNDTDEHWALEPIATLMTVNGQVLRTVHLDPCTVRPRSVTRVPLPDNLAHGTAADRLLAVRCRSADVASYRAPYMNRALTGRAIHFHGPDKDLALPRARWTIEAERTGSTWTIKVLAQTLVRGLVLHVDKLDPEARLSDQLFTLLPGEEVTLRMNSKRNWHASELAQAPVALAVNG